MTAQRPRSPEPPFRGAVPLQTLLADRPPVRDVGTNVDEIRAGRRVVVLDDDPTGTQTIADLPVLTRWAVEDLRWALQQPTTGFFVLTNTRSLSEADAAERNREIVQALAAAAQQLFLIAEAAGLGAHDDSSVVTVLYPDTQERTTT